VNYRINDGGVMRNLTQKEIKALKRKQAEERAVKKGAA
jgi:hypothetical protein